jgi:hypothetical protein
VVLFDVDDDDVVFVFLPTDVLGRNKRPQLLPQVIPHTNTHKNTTKQKANTTTT